MLKDRIVCSRMLFFSIFSNIFPTFVLVYASIHAEHFSWDIYLAPSKRFHLLFVIKITTESLCLCIVYKFRGDINKNGDDAIIFFSCVKKRSTKNMSLNCRSLVININISVNDLEFIFIRLQHVNKILWTNEI